MSEATPRWHVVICVYTDVREVNTSPQTVSAMDRIASDTETDDYEQPLLHRKKDDDIKRGE